jgi:hypothetical protein
MVLARPSLSTVRGLPVDVALDRPPAAGGERCANASQSDQPTIRRGRTRNDARYPHPILSAAQGRNCHPVVIDLLSGGIVKLYFFGLAL